MAHLLLALVSVATVSAAPIMTWISQPVYAGQTLVVHGAGFDDTLNATLTTSDGTQIVLPCISGQTSESSAKFALPSTLPVDVYNTTLSTSTSGPSPSFLINAATAWWFQGDIGTTATASGWIRVFGLALALSPPSSTQRSLQRSIRAVRDAMTAPIMAGDVSWGEQSNLADLAAQLLSLRAQLRAVQVGAAVPALKLTPVAGGDPVYIPASPGNVSAYSAHFPLPPDLTPGEYALAVSNGWGVNSEPGGVGYNGTFRNISFFESYTRPAVSSIVVQPVKDWPAAVFTVEVATDPCALPCPTSDDALAAALSAAADAGGGRVFFPRGRYFLSQAFQVPPNTVLVGAGADLTAIWFAEANQTTAPPIYIQLNNTAAVSYGGAPAMGAAGPGQNLTSWGVANLTLYITAFHNVVLYVSNRTDGFIMSGVRTRVNSYAFTWGPFTSSRGRWANWTDLQVGNLVDIHSVNNRIVDNDLFSTGTVLNSFQIGGNTENNWPNYRRGHQYSNIARNTIWNGQSSHFMQLWRQVIFEQNVITGATENAGGQSVGTGPMGGMAQHIYHGDNTIRFTWGGDREVMTYDDAGGSYWGPLASVNGTTVTTLYDTKAASDWEMGGWFGGQIVTINGTGMLQTRRIIVPGINTTATDTNRTWIIDEPFDVVPEVGLSGTFIEIMPFRGRVIFHRDRNVDVGPHQFYGHANENIVAEVYLERQRGLINWGQWRGWTPAPLVDGEMGNGWQPVLHTQYLENEHVEGNHLTNYNCNQTGYIEWWGGKTIVLYPISALNSNITGSPHPVHMGLVYRNTVIGSNGGFWVGNGTTDVVIEGSTVLNSDSNCIIVGAATEQIYSVNNSC